jgi:hypothetical protein
MSDDALREAVEQIEAGNYDADLGAGVFKQRVARTGEGQAGGFRLILCFKAGERVFFVYGFAKSDRANIAPNETREFRKLAKVLFAIKDEQLDPMLKNGEFDELS